MIPLNTKAHAACSGWLTLFKLTAAALPDEQSGAAPISTMRQVGNIFFAGGASFEPAPACWSTTESEQ